jgi:SAM-dependent methyltransferase
LFQKQFKWNDAEDNTRHYTDGLQHKIYGSYDEYIDHQKEKLNVIGDGMLDEIEKFESILYKRLAGSSVEWEGRSVLCLGARLGQEVRAFNSVGCFAVGVDLNPGKDNKNVVVGDFHNLQWGDSCVDVVYTNSLDHSFDLEKVIREIKRVLKNGGLMVLELNLGSKEGYEYGYYESVAWDRVCDVIDMFRKEGFWTVESKDFMEPFAGRHVIMGLTK